MNTREAAGRPDDSTTRQDDSTTRQDDSAAQQDDSAAQQDGSIDRQGGVDGREAVGRAGDGSSQALVGELCRQAAELIAVGGRMRRVRLQAGDAVVELEWPDVTAVPPVTAVWAPPAAAPPNLTSYPTADTAAHAALTAAPPNGTPADGSGTPAAASAGDDDLRHVCAPMVGTFYWASEPGAAPFVAVGDTVEKGQQVGIVEAMKLMNPIEADVSGKVVEVLVPDGTPVEYGQKLIAVAPPATP
ncbi:acetyl-CoA carboxylase biotin carboxyl carrier protein [Nonomuraea thailandensis]|uniref:Biotin carboxyl carrier protein of acetyl-CoA carboxylase n=1 Tax=Nonomuraea thailandensis TaxID=1188745 RepID=A0A9X2KAF2_9ACTN|nr:acetyl-CoA carboxylase biotin carboxyl carrier protein [Nonomuraea thailandensis]MCP2362891.1 acetyl-CoA carboxylase biotin carboxyl carrier protein [Nonomuraea thailandensis]